MLMNTLYIDVDNIILDFCNIANEDQSMINNLHILEECGVSTNRYFGGVWGVNKQIFWRSVGCQQTDILEECGVSTNRYFGGVWGVNKQIFKRC